MQQVTIETVLPIINASIKDVELTVENLNDNLTEFGVDSIAFIQIVVALEEILGCEIPDSKLILSEMDTINKLMEVLKSLYDEAG